MIISYAPIHHVEEYDGQKLCDQERAQEIAAVADRHEVFTRLNADGDTSYLETPVSLESLTLSLRSTLVFMDWTDQKRWCIYTEFLADLKESNIGYLLHEVDTDLEMALLYTLLPGGDDPYSLSRVDVEYRISAAQSESR